MVLFNLASLKVVPQGPILYTIFTFDMPTDDNFITAIFADNTGILSINESSHETKATEIEREN